MNLRPTKALRRHVVSPGNFERPYVVASQTNLPNRETGTMNAPLKLHVSLCLSNKSSYSECPLMGRARTQLWAAT